LTCASELVSVTEAGVTRAFAVNEPLPTTAVKVSEPAVADSV
jgi:hypothetical protein